MVAEMYSREDLLDVSHRIGLNEREIEIMMDLFGLNNPDGTIPSSYYCLEPGLSFVLPFGVMGNEEKKMSESVSGLIYRIMGEGKTASLFFEPIEILKNEFGLDTVSIAWLVAQLPIEELHEHFDGEIMHIATLQWTDVVKMVKLTIRKLIDARLNKA